jgi:hypothetical protein
MHYTTGARACRKRREERVHLSLATGLSDSGSKKASRLERTLVETDRAEIKPRRSAEANQREPPRAVNTIVLGDGPSAIWRLAAQHLPHSRQPVDWHHAREHPYPLASANWDLRRVLLHGTRLCTWFVDGCAPLSVFRHLAADDIEIHLAQLLGDGPNPPSAY